MKFSIVTLALLGTANAFNIVTTKKFAITRFPLQTPQIHTRLYLEEGEGEGEAEPAEEAAEDAPTQEAPAPTEEASAPAEAPATPSKFENEVGAQSPLGFWDPLGLVADGDQEKFDRLRTVELKHGRVSMLAITGHIVTTAGVRLPGDIDLHGTSFKSIGTGLKHITDVPALGWAQIFLLAGLMEFFVMKDLDGSGEHIGDFRNGVGFEGWNELSADDKLSKRAIELNNGRAAQMGILALMVHEMLNNDPYVLNGLLGFPVAFN